MMAAKPILGQLTIAILCWDEISFNGTTVYMCIACPIVHLCEIVQVCLSVLVEETHVHVFVCELSDMVKIHNPHVIITTTSTSLNYTNMNTHTYGYASICSLKTQHLTDVVDFETSNSCRRLRTKLCIFHLKE